MRTASRISLLLAGALAATTLTACGSSKDDDVKRCDKIADKYVEFFATEDEAGEVRMHSLRECVQGPEDESNSQRDAWLTCAEEARSGGDLIKCRLEYDHARKKAALDELGSLAKKVFVEGVCKQKTDSDDDYKELIESAEEAESKAREAGADSDEIGEATDLKGDKSFDELKEELCKGIEPEPPAAAAE